MNTFLLITVLILLLIYIIIFIRRQYPVQIYNFWNIRHIFKTGDIILFSCEKSPSFLTGVKHFLRKYILDAEYGHVGVVIKKNKKLFVIECVDATYDKNLDAHRYNKSGKGGIRISELEKVLARYHKKYNGTFMVRFISKEIPNNIIMDRVQKIRDKIFETNNNILILGFIDLCISHELAEYFADMKANNNRLTCGEFVHKLLYDCDVLHDYKSKICWPHIFIGNTFNNMQKIKYSDLYKFTYCDKIIQ